MAVVFDPEKDAANLAKHGLSLKQAGSMDLSAALVRADTRRDYGEVRWLAYGRIEGRMHVLAFTVRGETVRAISLRKANARERRRYG